MSSGQKYDKKTATILHTKMMKAHKRKISIVRHIIQADHDGYCSGYENELEEFYENIIVDLPPTDKLLKSGDDVKDLFPPEREEIDCGGSGYCDPAY